MTERLWSRNNAAACLISLARRVNGSCCNRRHKSVPEIEARRKEHATVVEQLNAGAFDKEMEKLDRWATISASR